MSSIQVVGLILLVIGAVMIALALLIDRIFSREEGSGASVAGIVLIGPIPIVFGRNVTKGMLVTLAAVGMLAALAIAVVYLVSTGGG